MHDADDIRPGPGSSFRQSQATPENLRDWADRMMRYPVRQDLLSELLLNAASRIEYLHDLTLELDKPRTADA